MSNWPAKKARLVLAALEKIGWRKATGRFPPHAELRRVADVIFAFHDDVEIGPKMLGKIAKKTGLTPNDL